VIGRRDPPPSVAGRRAQLSTAAPAFPLAVLRADSLAPPALRPGPSPQETDQPTRHGQQCPEPSPRAGDVTETRRRTDARTGSARSGDAAPWTEAATRAGPRCLLLPSAVHMRCAAPAASCLHT